jgi:adenylosuccinate synthase
VDGWEQDISVERVFSDLPDAAQDYVHQIEETLKVDIKIVSNGPKRNQIIVR